MGTRGAVHSDLGRRCGRGPRGQRSAGRSRATRGGCRSATWFVSPVSRSRRSARRPRRCLLGLLVRRADRSPALSFGKTMRRVLIAASRRCSGRRRGNVRRSGGRPPLRREPVELVDDGRPDDGRSAAREPPRAHGGWAGEDARVSVFRPAGGAPSVEPPTPGRPADGVGRPPRPSRRGNGARARQTRLPETSAARPRGSVQVPLGAPRPSLPGR